MADPSVGGDDLFTVTDIAYVVDWITHLQSDYNITLDYMAGGWNEHPYNATYIKLLRTALNAAGLTDTKITASDEWDPNHCWAIAKDMLSDPELYDAVFAISTHVAGAIEHNDPTPSYALQLGKPIWQGEEHFGVPDPDPVPNWEWPAASSSAIYYSQNWVLNNMSATVMWPETYSWASGIQYRGKGLLTATSPWGSAASNQSGLYYVPPAMWMPAHTTHFTEAGSWYLLNNSGSGHVPGTAGWNVSYVTYVGPQASVSSAAAAQRPFTVVIESMFEGPVTASSTSPTSAPGPVTASFQLSGGLLGWAGQSLSVWHSNQSVTFEREADVGINADGTFSLTIEPAAIYTLTTVASSHPGARALLAGLGPSTVMVHGDGSLEIPALSLSSDAWSPSASRVSPGDIEAAVGWSADNGPSDAPFPLPYADDFEGYANDTLPLYTSDMFGAFGVWDNTSATTDNAGFVSATAAVTPLRYHHDAAVRSAVVCSTDADHALRPGRCLPPLELANSLPSHSQSNAPRSNGKVLRQFVRQPPIGWGGDSTNMASIIGNYSLTGVSLNISFLIETPTWPVNATGKESVYFGLRAGTNGCAGCTLPSAFYKSPISAYTWTLSIGGGWVLQDAGSKLASGTLPSGLQYDTWHTVFFGDYTAAIVDDTLSSGVQLVGVIDGQQAFNLVPSGSRDGGYVVIGTGVNRVQFDNLYLASTA